MIRLIAAVDRRRGVADDRGIPWRLPGDVASFRRRTLGGVVAMGRATYAEFAAPLPDRVNLVLTTSTEALRPGFTAVRDLDALFAEHGAGDLWVIGGAGVFGQTIDRADELVLTQVEGDFSCTKFFPAYEESFTLADRGEDRREGVVGYRFEIWSPGRRPAPT